MALLSLGLFAMLFVGFSIAPAMAYEEIDRHIPYESDPEWESIEPLAQKIMDAIPMGQIQSLWESGQNDALAELIVSETDLTIAQANQVLAFFERVETEESDQHIPYESDPEWESIEPLAQKIMDAIPMGQIQSLWESGQNDALVELIVSETDLTIEQANQVLAFFERVENEGYAASPLTQNFPPLIITPANLLVETQVDVTTSVRDDPNGLFCHLHLHL